MTQAPYDGLNAVSPLTPGTALSPTSGGERIIAIDVLRGVVLLGILVMNIPFMGWPDAWAMEPVGVVDNTLFEKVLWFLADVFMDTRMMSIFSLLFGLGIVLVAERAAAAGKSPAALHYKRMVWLLLIGLVHLFLMWNGDILVIYALVGSLVFLLRRLRVAWLVMIGAGLIAMTLVAWIAIDWAVSLFDSVDPAVAEGAEELGDEGTVEAEITNYRGGLLSQFKERFAGSVFMVLIAGPYFYFWWAGGMMLLGMAAMKARLITAERSVKTYAWMLAVGWGIGLPLASWLAWGDLKDAAFFEEAGYLFSALDGAASLLVVCGWVGGVMLLCKQACFAKLSHPLACVGRMALTNYLSQTLIVTFIFYGHGLGMFAELDRPAMFGIVLGVWLLQLIWSPLWLAKFRFGPMEWLWRSLTYLRFEPMLKRS